jgi:hypothetical protein
MIGIGCRRKKPKPDRCCVQVKLPDSLRLLCR